MKKIIRNIFTHNKPKIIINLKINKNNYESYLNNYGKNNKNKTFYIIKREVGSGFFSNFFFCSESSKNC